MLVNSPVSRLSTQTYYKSNLNQAPQTQQAKPLHYPALMFGQDSVLFGQSVDKPEGIGTDWILFATSPESIERFNKYFHDATGPIIKVAITLDGHELADREDSSYRLWRQWHQDGKSDTEKFQLLRDRVHSVEWPQARDGQNEFYKQVILARQRQTPYTRIHIRDDNLAKAQEHQYLKWLFAFFKLFNSANEDLYTVEHEQLKNICKPIYGGIPPYDYCYFPGQGIVLNWYASDGMYRQFLDENKIEGNEEAHKLRMLAMYLKQAVDQHPEWKMQHDSSSSG